MLTAQAVVRKRYLQARRLRGQKARSRREEEESETACHATASASARTTAVRARTARSVSPALQKTHGTSTMHLCFRILMIKTNRGRGNPEAGLAKADQKKCCLLFGPAHTCALRSHSSLARAVAFFLASAALPAHERSGAWHWRGVGRTSSSRRSDRTSCMLCSVQCGRGVVAGWRCVAW